MPEPEISRTDRSMHGVVAGLLAAVFALSVAGVDQWKVETTSLGELRVPTICLLHRVTGLPCAACGLTRSFCALGHGSMGRAIDEHPLGPVVFVILAAVLVRSAVIAIRGRMWLPRVGRGLVWSVPVLVVVGLALWGARLWMMFASGAGAEAWRTSPLGMMLASMGY
jgi:hypothetical protein